MDLRGIRKNIKRKHFYDICRTNGTSHILQIVWRKRILPYHNCGEGNSRWAGRRQLQLLLLQVSLQDCFRLECKWERSFSIIFLDHAIVTIFVEWKSKHSSTFALSSRTQIIGRFRFNMQEELQKGIRFYLV